MTDVMTYPKIDNVERYYAQTNAPGWYQLGITLCIYAILLVALYLLMPYSWLFSLPLIFLLGLSITRLFIIQHDCSHQSLFPGKHLNDYVGRALSLITLVPFFSWRWQHLIHHKTSSNLDKRGIGDVPLLTVDEYTKL